MYTPHAWDVTPAEAIAIQKELRNKVQIQSFTKPIKTIAGVDVSLERFGTELFAGIVVLSYPEMEIVDYAVTKVDVTFPYVPGLLSFREIPGLLECFKKLNTKPDVVMVDGQGIAHPRRLGIAAHLGLFLGIPTIGVAKSRLYGVGDEPIEPGDTVSLVDPKTDETIGMMLKVKARAKPIIISPGNNMDVESALRITLQTLRGYRLPEPTRQAHLLVNKFRTGEL
jgi:deoxyribonuclease V